MGSLVRHRVELPTPVEACIHRESLLRRLDPAERRITVLNAPGGFGKTTLLADACRRIRKRGQIAAWLVVEEQDDPTTLLGCMALALVDAGLDPVEFGDQGEADARLELLLARIEEHGGPCVLALDEVDSLTSDASLDLLDRMLRTAPANLHLVVAYREHPQRLEIAPWILDGRGSVITVEDLRFRKTEVDRFFDGQLSTRRIEDVLKRSQGWPLALRLERNRVLLHRPPAEGRETAENWVSTQLFRGLDAAEREFIQDVCLFDRIDGDLLDGVLGPGSMKRLRAMPMLVGLLEPLGKSGTLSLHELVRTSCSEHLYREHPERFRSVHRRIAQVLAGRGDVVEAMRHAKSADEPDLAARILEDAGAVRLWLRFGIGSLKRADDLVTPQMLHGRPRLVLARSALLAASGRFDRAIALYTGNGRDAPGGGRDGADDAQLEFDEIVLRALYFLYMCRPVSSPEVLDLVAASRKNADSAHPDRLVRGVSRYGIALFEHLRGRPDAAAEQIAEAGRDLASASNYMSMYASLGEGVIAFARGRSQDAAAAYRRGFDICKREFAFDTGPLASWNALVGELRLERHEMASLGAWSVDLEHLGERGAWLDVFVAAATVTSELAIARGDAARAVDGLRKGVEFARRTGRQALRRALAAQCAGALVRAGNATEAGWLWRDAGLPTTPDECARLGEQSWREMECLCRARAWLQLAEGDLASARRVADAFAAGATRAGLTRSLGWALALSAAIEAEAGDSDRALAHLAAYRTLLAETGYSHPLICLAPRIRPLLRTQRDNAQAPLAELDRVLESAEARAGPEAAPALTARETQVLRRLEQASDKQVAVALGISVNGVRYHLGNIFRKLGVRDRRAAARRARELGLATSKSATR